MAILKTAGTQLYFVDPADDSVVEVGCPISIEGLSAPSEQVETTCLSDTVRTYTAGLKAPGTATFTLNFNPNDPSHIRLNELYLTGENLNWAIGHSDGTAPPTVDSAGDFVAAATRSWLFFDGYVSDYTFTYALNANVQSALSLQISGARTVVPKTA